MRSEVAKRILADTPQEVRDKVRQYGNDLVNKKVEYRKHKSGREFIRLDGPTVVRVQNFLELAEIRVSNNPVTAEYIKDDKDIYFPCTEQEFNTAYQEALQRIKEMKIL